MSPTIDPKVSLFAANQVEVIYNLCTSDDPTNGPDNIKYTDWVDVSDGDEYYTLKDYTLEGQRLLGYMRGPSYYDLDISGITLQSRMSHKLIMEVILMVGNMIHQNLENLMDRCIKMR